MNSRTFKRLAEWQEQSIREHLRDNFDGFFLTDGYPLENSEDQHGNSLLSIQASKGHYCDPREDLEDRMHYQSVELHIADHPRLALILCSMGYIVDDSVLGWVKIEDLARALVILEELS